MIRPRPHRYRYLLYRPKSMFKNLVRQSLQITWFLLIFKFIVVIIIYWCSDEEGEEEEGEEKAKGKRGNLRPAILEDEALAGQGMGAALKVQPSSTTTFMSYHLSSFWLHSFPPPIISRYPPEINLPSPCHLPRTFMQGCGTGPYFTAYGSYLQIRPYLGYCKGPRNGFSRIKIIT